jgi:hypothetical protein
MAESPKPITLGEQQAYQLADVQKIAPQFDSLTPPMAYQAS